MGPSTGAPRRTYRTAPKRGLYTGVSGTFCIYCNLLISRLQFLQKVPDTPLFYG